MVTTDDIGMAQFFFFLGNLCFLAKIVFSGELEGEHGIPSLLSTSEPYSIYSDNSRVTAVTVAIFLGLFVTSLECIWADGKRIRPLSSQPPSLQAPLAPTYVIRIAPSTPKPTSSKVVPKPPVKVVPPADAKKGPDQPAAGELPKTAPNAPAAQYPIVEVSAGQVTYASDSKKLNIAIVIVNSTSTNTNAHIVLQPVWVNSGQEATNDPLPSETRDIGLGPPPYNFQLKEEMGLSDSGAASWDAGTLAVMFYLTITYPDRGKTTTYHYKAEARKGLDQLDYLESDWQ